MVGETPASGPGDPSSAPQVRIRAATPDRATEVLEIIRDAFSGRPTLDPPAPALSETTESVQRALAGEGGVIAEVDGRGVAACLLSRKDTVRGSSLELRRVSVRPAAQHLGVARTVVRAAEEVARLRGLRRVHLTARAELPATVRFWQRLGYREVERAGEVLVMARELPVELSAEEPRHTQEIGRRLGAALREGDLVLLSGDLGAGKTTLTQGIGLGLGVRGQVTSPTFVLSRVHPSESGGPRLVHVDAYRLRGVAELDDLDLDVSLEESVTVVEWGGGVAERLADERLEIEIDRPGSPDGPLEAGERRTLRLTPVGARWVGSDLADLAEPG